ncbi:MAG: iron ABC transporter permease [Cytophagales bacterium]|nr:iron ABC transporter permease [Cytophagales bacterium]
MIESYLQRSKKRWTIIFVLLMLLVVVLFITNLSLGSVYIPFSNFWQYFSDSGTGKESWDLIIRNFRLPKAWTAVFTGAALGVSGLQMQTLFRNPLAGPFILGISSGAGLGVALAIFTGIYFGFFFDLTGLGRSWTTVIAAGVGSFLVLITILLASSRLKDGVSLLIVGLMFGTIASAIVGILQFFSQAENIQAYVIWSFGSLGGVSQQELIVFQWIIFAGLILAMALSKPLNALLLGEQYAASIGLNLKRIRFLVILNTSLLAGTVTAFCGPVAFIGLAVPHLVRMLFNTSNHLQLTPLIILFGSGLVLIFDIISQVPGSDLTLPLNAVTALFGGPFVIWVLLKKRTINFSG